MGRPRLLRLALLVLTLVVPPLVRQFGSREAVVEQMLRGVSGRTPVSGVFEIPVSIGGQNVVVRGAVVDGVVKLGTAFTP